MESAAWCGSMRRPTIWPISRDLAARRQACVGFDANWSMRFLRNIRPNDPDASLQAQLQNLRFGLVFLAIIRYRTLEPDNGVTRPRPLGIIPSVATSFVRDRPHICGLT